MSANQIKDLNKIYLEAVYGGTPEKKEEPKDTRHVVISISLLPIYLYIS